MAEHNRHAIIRHGYVRIKYFLESRRRLKKRKELFIELLKYNKDVELYDVKENDHNSYRLLFKYKDEVNVIDLRQLVSDLKKYKKVSQ